MKKRITISDIAKKAEVSKGAAWAALSKSKNNVRLAPKTRTRILKVARKLDYQPNIMARGLILQKSLLLGFFFYELNWHVAMQLIRNIQMACYSREYSLVVYPANSLEKELRNLKSGINRQLDGILTVPVISDHGNNAAEYNRIAGEVMPIVQIIFKISPESPFVGRDYYQIGYDAAQYLIERGHTQIGLITFSNYKDQVQGASYFLLYQGYRKAMSEAGLNAKVYPVDCGSDMTRTDSSYKTTEKILSSSYAPTALIANSNGLAYGAIKRFQELGIRVPEEISVIGCADSIELPGCMVPELTHFPVPFDTIGELAVQKCLNLQDQDLPNEIYLKEKIKEGTTVCRCKQGDVYA